MTLKTTFVSGDGFTPGTTASTDALNGINNTINNKLIYVGSDLVTGSATGTTDETTIGSVTIPASTVTTGIIVMVCGRIHAITDQQMTFRLKIGAAGSEVTKFTLITNPKATGGDFLYPTSLQWYETGQTWTNEISVIVTSQTADTNSTSYCDTIIITGV